MQPFSSLADSLDALMIAHVVYPEVDTLPAGYSRNWLQGVLRTDMAYQGVIVSDDLGMHAAKSAGGLAERTRLCLDAGCDLVLVCIPEDVAVLLAELDGSLGDASTAVNRLYGNPTVNREELVSVDREGIREWRRWQQSLEDLGEQSWS
jgi:beta-N-acetylhexosaminidase